MSARRSMSRKPLLFAASLVGLLMLLFAAPSQATFAFHFKSPDVKIDLGDGHDRDYPVFRFPSFHHDDEEDDGPEARKRWDGGKLRELFAAKREKRADRRERIKALLADALEKLRDEIREKCKPGDHDWPGDGGDDDGWQPKPKPKPPVVPEPSTAILMGLGLAGLGHAGRRVRR